MFLRLLLVEWSLLLGIGFPRIRTTVFGVIRNHRIVVSAIYIPQQGCENCGALGHD